LSRVSERSAGIVRTRAEDSDEEEGLALANVTQLFGDVPGPRAMPLGATAAGSEDMSAELEELKTEPSGEEECAAKFKLYEGYSQEVEKIRATLFQFYEENAPTLPPAVARDMGHQLRGIDSNEGMGVPDDDGRTWFVYHMMRQAIRNNRVMAGILEGFKRRLEQLANNDQTECPICLEAFASQGPRKAETLSCCHKLCQDCWAHWKRVQHGRPFCPLCRHEEFLNAVTDAAMHL